MSLQNGVNGMRRPSFLLKVFLRLRPHGVVSSASRVTIRPGTPVAEISQNLARRSVPTQPVSATSPTTDPASAIISSGSEFAPGTELNQCGPLQKN
jgi:hypothetical protein